jgi:hypothetical protein
MDQPQPASDVFGLFPIPLQRVPRLLEPALAQARGSTECRDAHLAGFAVPLTRAAGARRTRHGLRA